MANLKKTSAALVLSRQLWTSSVSTICFQKVLLMNQVEGFSFQVAESITEAAESETTSMSSSTRPLSGSTSAPLGGIRKMSCWLYCAHWATCSLAYCSLVKVWLTSRHAVWELLKRLQAAGYTGRRFWELGMVEAG